jgi:hypothetical protein
MQAANQLGLGSTPQHIRPEPGLFVGLVALGSLLVIAGLVVGATGLLMRFVLG